MIFFIRLHAWLTIQFHFKRTGDKSSLSTMENAVQQPKPKSQLSKAKGFEITLEWLAALGISPALPTQAYPSNGRILVGFLILGCATTCTFVFILNDAKTFIEYTQTTFACSLMTLGFFALVTLTLKSNNLFEWINECDELADTSELKSIQYATASLIYTCNIYCDKTIGYCMLPFHFSVEIFRIEINFSSSRSV